MTCGGSSASVSGSVTCQSAHRTSKSASQSGFGMSNWLPSAVSKKACVNSTLSSTSPGGMSPLYVMFSSKEGSWNKARDVVEGEEYEICSRLDCT